MSSTRYRVASTHPEENALGATFGPGEEALDIDPSQPDDARKIEEGRFVAILEDAPEPEAKALKPAPAKTTDNQEGSK